MPLSWKVLFFANILLATATSYGHGENSYEVKFLKEHGIFNWFFGQFLAHLEPEILADPCWEIGLFSIILFWFLYLSRPRMLNWWRKSREKSISDFEQQRCAFSFTEIKQTLSYDSVSRDLASRIFLRKIIVGPQIFHFSQIWCWPTKLQCLFFSCPYYPLGWAQMIQVWPPDMGGLPKWSTIYMMTPGNWARPETWLENTLLIFSTAKRCS